MKTPIIGIILDLEQEGSFSKYPYYALRRNYFDSVIKAGGLPVAIPYSNIDDMKKYYQMIDGLLIPGGDFDIPPEMYGEKDIHHTVKFKPDRTQFEFGIAKLCMDDDKPMLGICGGMQLLNVLNGGSLIQDIPSHYESNIAHSVKDRCVEAHNVEIKEDSDLFKIVKVKKFGVNTAHHQGVKKVGNNMVVNAVADDKMIEGIEHKTQKFCLGVQWHPEYLVTEADFRIIEAFVKACR